MAVLPAFGERSVPERVRLVLTIAFTLVVAPTIIPEAHVPPNAARLLANMLSEIGIGLLFGLSIRLFFMVLQIAGTIVGQSSSLSQIFGFNAIDAQPTMAHVLWIAGVCIAVMFDFHVHIASVFVQSYEVFPLGSTLAGSDVLSFSLRHVSRLFSLSFSLAAPFIIASLIYNIALGAINRAMPQLMVAFVGAPAITFGGLFLFFVAAPLIIGLWSTELMRLLADPLGSYP